MSSPRRRARVVRRNGRLGIEPPPAQSSLASLPSIHPTPGLHVPHAQQQQQELLALRDAFRERLRTQKKLYDFQPMRTDVAIALEARSNRARDSSGGERQHPDGDDHEAFQEDEDDGMEDCFTFVQRFSRLLEPKYPFAAQFVDTLARKIQDIVHEKLHAEAIAASVNVISPRFDRIYSCVPEKEAYSDGSDGIAEEDNDSKASSSSENEESDGPDESTTKRTRGGIEAPKSNTFRTSLRCRKFPPTRVPKDEHIVTSCAYTPFDYSKSSDLSSIHLESSGVNKGKQWYVVQFPKLKPSVTRLETEAFVQWAQSKLSSASVKACEENGSYADKETQFRRQLALYEHICYELSRLVFDKCPTTARFVHGLFVELVDTTLRTVLNADRDTQVNDQRYKNVQQELQRLAAKLEAVRASLTSLEETLMKRQRHLLGERERIIRQRKKLNLLLCADQILIRSVAGLIQHLLDLSEELITALTVDDPHGLLGGGQSVIQPLHSGSDGVGEPQRFEIVDELYELVKSKYQNLGEVQKTIKKVEEARKEAEELAKEAVLSIDAAEHAMNTPARSEQVIILDIDKVVTATEDFKNALRRLNRLVSTKSPDSIVGWDAQELWDQALFIPPHEDIQDLDRDVLRLCKHVEDHILRRRHQVRELGCHVAVQTDISACVSFRPRGRANGFVSFPTTFTFEPDQSTLISEVSKGIETLHGNKDIREEHREILEKFLPVEFRHFVNEIPDDFSPRQLSISSVHSIISYLFNEMWLLIQEEFLRQPKKFTITATTATLLPVASIHEYVYRIYLLHFREPSFVTSRLLDLLVSASRLDTQSCKVLLFCRLLNLPGVDPLSKDAFWFVLKALHVLQRACTSTGNYFHLDASGENEFIPHSSATDALNILFRGATNDVMKRLRLRLAGLASVYGAIWIPASSVIEFVMEEWKAAQDALRMTIKEKIVQEQYADSASQSATAKSKQLPSFDAFLRVFQELHLKPHRLEAAQAYRQLISSSRQVKKHGGGDVATVDVELFNQQWMQLILHAVNQAQQQQFVPASHASNAGSGSGIGAAASSGIHFGVASDVLLSANRHLSFCFLRATWEQTKKDFIRWLDVEFHDIGLQVRLIQQMDNILIQEETAVQVGWKSLQQLIQIASTGKLDSLG